MSQRGMDYPKPTEPQEWAFSHKASHVCIFSAGWSSLDATSVVDLDPDPLASVDRPVVLLLSGPLEGRSIIPGMT